MPCAIFHRLAALSLLALGAWGMAGCGSTQQKMDLTPQSINTPPHHMSRGDYPFDTQGRYIDAWAAEGAARYGRRVNSDSDDEGRAARRAESASRRAATPPSSRQKAAARKTPPASKSKPRAASHTVKRGDSLSSISRRYGVSVQELKRANGLKSNTIQTGRRLKVPR